MITLRYNKYVRKSSSIYKMRQNFAWFISSVTTFLIVVTPCWGLNKSVRKLGVF